MAKEKFSNKSRKPTSPQKRGKSHAGDKLNKWDPADMEKAVKE